MLFLPLKKDKKIKISLIAAIGRNRELGKDNRLLWHLPEDLKRFKQLTQRHAVIMGRKTFESIGRPLPERLNIVITRKSKLEDLSPKLSFKIENLFFCHSLEAAIKLAKETQKVGNLLIKKDEIFIIGGGQIYQQAIKHADKLYLTIIDQSFPDADTFFPDFSRFKKVIFEKQGKRGEFRYKWLVLTK